MEIDFERRRISLGVKDFVTFGRFEPESFQIGFAGSWRSRTGQQWHQQLAEESRRLHGNNCLTEVPIHAEISFCDWVFELQGRLDQVLIADSPTFVREIKTTHLLLPEKPELLENAHPAHFGQMALYLRMCEACENLPFPSPVKGELLFVNFSNGIRQSVPIRKEHTEALDTAFESWCAFLESRRSSRELWQQTPPPLAFEELRPEQKLTRTRLVAWEKANTLQNQATRFALEASTGFGKTALALEHAFRLMQSSTVDRIVYLTGKNSGQIQVIRELERFRLSIPGIRPFQMRNLETHKAACKMRPCACAQPFGTSVDTNAGTGSIPWSDIAESLARETPSIHEIAGIAGSAGLCPRAISMACLCMSDTWIGDYNYLLSPGASILLEALPGFDPQRTFLIIDEAHNLHERCASNFSSRFHAAAFATFKQWIPETSQHRDLRRCISSILDYLNSLPAGSRLDDQVLYEWHDLIERMLESVSASPLTLPDLPLGMIELIWEIQSCARALRTDHLAWHTSCPQEGAIDITCIDASAWIALTLSPFARILFLSATFPPDNGFMDQTGHGKSPFPIFRIGTEWRAGAYDVAIDMRMDTRFHNRRANYLLTTDTLATLAASTSLPVIAFFPSYSYAETIAEYVRVTYPHLRIDAMPRKMESGDQVAYLSRELDRHDVLCIPLGSGLSEGIDFLGGRVDTVMVVGPALPEVNDLQKERMERRQSLGDPDPFRSVYLVPGMIRVNQALGRLVRAPGQHAKVLLHCKRFADPSYADLLSTDYHTETHIDGIEDLIDWILIRKSDTSKITTVHFANDHSPLPPE